MLELSYSDMSSLNFYRRASPEWKLQHYIDSETSKITTKPTADWESPWDFINNDPKRTNQCRDAQDFFKMYDMVPPFCIDCWKVVVKPQKHSELIALRNLQIEMAAEDPECWCKCGIELRTYVPGLYGGYFYTNSKEAGLKRLDQVRKKVCQCDMDPNVPIILKRYCTEFEIKLGDTAKYKMPDNAEALEEYYLSTLAKRTYMKPQPELIKLEVHMGWIDFGWKFGTPEDRKEIEDTYNDGKPLHPKPRTYEE